MFVAYGKLRNRKFSEDEKGKIIEIISFYTPNNRIHFT
jgi:hypothetical protein